MYTKSCENFLNTNEQSPALFTSLAKYLAVLAEMFNHRLVLIVNLIPGVFQPFLVVQNLGP